MKNHRLPALLLAVSLALLVSGCKSQETVKPAAPPASSAAAVEPAVSPEPADAAPSAPTWTVAPTQAVPEGMAVYSTCPFVYQDADWEVQTLVQEDMLENGQLMLDDRGHFCIQAVSGSDRYVFLDAYIQLGVPEADVWVDTQDTLHVTLRDVRTALYQVTDFSYDAKTRTFTGLPVLEGDGISYLGTTAR